MAKTGQSEMEKQERKYLKGQKKREKCSPWLHRCSNGNGVYLKVSVCVRGGMTVNG